MIQEPILIVMAAGMGSRYGGLKQIDPIGDNGETIIDFSLYDAFRAGFRRVIFLIKPELEQDFKSMVGQRVSSRMEVRYAFQCVDDLPHGYAPPEGRTKPWGTGHAVLACRELIDAPFAVINADDYYGKSAFQSIYQFLHNAQDDDLYRYAMVGYQLENTLTDHGHVARGVCTIGEDGFLQAIHERVRIEKHPEGAQYTEDDGASWVTLSENSIVSMNLWGFTPDFIGELGARFPSFLDAALAQNPQKAEYFLPSVVDQLIHERKATVQVLNSHDRWYGVTYREDKPVVVQAISSMQANGLYPRILWEVEK